MKSHAHYDPLLSQLYKLSNSTANRFTSVSLQTWSDIVDSMWCFCLVCLVAYTVHQNDGDLHFFSVRITVTRAVPFCFLSFPSAKYLVEIQSLRIEPQAHLAGIQAKCCTLLSGLSPLTFRLSIALKLNMSWEPVSVQDCCEDTGRLIRQVVEQTKTHRWRLARVLQVF